MLSTFWNTLFINPIVNALVALYHYTGNLGISIIILTLFIRVVLVPLMIPSMRTMKKQKELQPEIDKLKNKYKKDKKKLAEAQMELFKKHGLNPAAGCITQIPMFLVLIALYGAIQRISQIDHIIELNGILYFEWMKFSIDSINTRFLYMDLARPDQYYILALLAGLFQFFTSKVTMGFTKKAEQIAKKTPDKSDDIAYNIQEQMLYIMPVITVIIGLTLPSGAVLYILTTTIFSLVQTYLMLGGKKELKI
jgi:YidC/Oxa1 family membrane protein insertase